MGILKPISKQASFYFCAIQPLDLYHSEREFVVVYVYTVTVEIIRKQFSCGPLKIVRTFLGHGSVTKKIIYPLNVYLKMQNR